jgi:hypothetical protein
VKRRDLSVGVKPTTTAPAEVKYDEAPKCAPNWAALKDALAAAAKPAT